LEKLNGEVTVFAVSVRGHWHLDFTFKDDQNTTMRKHGAQNLQTMKRVTLAILSLVQSYYDNRSLKGIRVSLSLGFEEHIEAIFKLLNAQAVQNFLLLRAG
jgi:hypothetical protein